MPKLADGKTHPNLAYIDGTLTSAVYMNAGELKTLVEDESVTYEDLNAYVLEMLDGCKQTPWIKKARITLDKIHNKTDLAFFVYNSFLSGENLASPDRR